MLRTHSLKNSYNLSIPARFSHDTTLDFWLQLTGDQLLGKATA